MIQLLNTARKGGSVMTIRWDEITLDNLSALEKVFEIYDRTFPIEVCESHNIFEKSLQYAKNERFNNYRFLVGFEGEKLVSFATGHYFADVNSGFIVYIVTNPMLRSKGVGTQTLLKLEELLNEDALLAGNPSLKALFLETETKDMVHTEEEKENCIKRDRFFSMNDFKRFQKIDYLQPPLHLGENNVPLNLYIKSIQTSEITEAEIVEVIRVIFKEKYYLVNGIQKDILYRCLEEMGLKRQEVVFKE